MSTAAPATPGSDMSRTWSLLSNATAAVSALKLDTGLGASSRPGIAGSGAGLSQRAKPPPPLDSTLTLSPQASLQDFRRTASYNSTGGGMMMQRLPSGALRTSLPLRVSSETSYGGSAGGGGSPPMSPTSAGGGGMLLGATASLMMASSGTPGADSSYHALKSSMSRLEQQNRQLSQRGRELEEQLVQRAREWHQERTQLQEMVRAQAQQLDVLRQEHGSTSKQHEAASVEVGRYKSELQAVQQQLASTQAVAEKRAQEVLELNRMLQAWDEMRQAQDVQIAGLVARAAKAEALTCQQVAGVRSRRY